MLNNNKIISAETFLAVHAQSESNMEVAYKLCKMGYNIKPDYVATRACDLRKRLRKAGVEMKSFEGIGGNLGSLTRKNKKLDANKLARLYQAKRS